MLINLARTIARNGRRRPDYNRSHVTDTALAELASEKTSADELVLGAERHALTLGCLSTMNEVQRAVVKLRLVDEIPGQNVARLMGMTPAHVAVLPFRAKQYLRQCVEGIESLSPSRAQEAPAK